MNEEVLTIDRHWSLFLDRDGVINKKLEDDYVKNTDEFEFLPGVLESLRYLTDFFRYVFVVTNQQGVGKGIMSEEDLTDVHEFMMREVEKSGGYIDAIAYCTELASKPDNCRKPNPDMGLQILEAFEDIEFDRSIMVGDSISDIEFAKNLGMMSVYVGPRSKKIKVDADFRLGSLYDLYLILKRMENEENEDQ